MVNPIAKAALPYVALAVTALVWRCQDTARQRAIGAAEVQLKAAEHSRDSLKVVKDSLAAAYRVDTVRLTRTLVRRDTVLQTVREYVDRDVPVPVDVVREIVKADSQVIAACTSALRTCEQEKAALRSDIGLLSSQLTNTRKLLPSFWDRSRTTVRDAAIGAALCFFFCPKR